MYIWLMAEDSLIQDLLMKRALAHSALPVELHTVLDGEQALAFLRYEPPYATAPSPDLILLDICMPRKNGLEVLAEIKQDPRLKRIPVVMVSASQEEEDIRASYDLGASAYLKKPLTAEEHLATVNTLYEFWCKLVLRPKR